jgi:hypothetical protein
MSTPINPKRLGFLHTFRQSLRWTRSSYYLLSGFIALIGLIGYAWWPLLDAYLKSYNPQISFWRQMDWLLLGDFFAMTLLIMINADLRTDWIIVAIGFAGGLVIESWGTQTNLWFYYTSERPPLWIIPAWPIASLSIDRLYRMLRFWTQNLSKSFFQVFYWIVFAGFLIYMLMFVRFTLDKSLTLMAVFLCAFMILTPRDPRGMLLTFIAGSALGYFLERWGTTRQCWTYYTYQTPPFFAVLAHGMAAVAFYRVRELYLVILPRIAKLLQKWKKRISKGETSFREPDPTGSP